MSKKNRKPEPPHVSIDCRSVGPGGTYVVFHATAGGVKAIWTNENCPYENDGVVIDEVTREASDGHNVSHLSYGELRAILKYAERNGWATPD